MTYYVNMTDKFMSGWGAASRGRSLLCIQCDTLEQAEAIEEAAHDRPEMKHIAIAKKPRRPRDWDHVSIRPFEELSGPWLTYWRETA